MSEELKPCPFCGNHEFVKNRCSAHMILTCVFCRTVFQLDNVSGVEAWIDRWNQRSAPSAVQEETGGVSHCPNCGGFRHTAWSNGALNLAFEGVGHHCETCGSFETYRRLQEKTLELPGGDRATTREGQKDALLKHAATLLRASRYALRKYSINAEEEHAGYFDSVHKLLAVIDSTQEVE